MRTSGVLVHRRDTMSTSGNYHEYIGGCWGCSVHWGHTISTSGDIMMHVGGGAS